MIKATIVTIGDELLIGQVVDTNSAWIAQQIIALGIEIKEILSISDNAVAIVEGLDRATQSSDLVLITGGLGPTEDDITKKTLAQYFDSELYFDEAVFNRIQRLFTKLGREPLAAHHQQAYMPRKADILENKMGTAPGMWFEKNDKVVISMPGVPYEMKSIMTHAVMPRLENLDNQNHILSRTLCTSGQGESQIAEQIADIISNFPAEMSIAFLPSKASVRLRLTAKGKDADSLKQMLDQVVEDISSVLKDLIYAQSDEKMESSLGKLLLEKKLTLAFAESCTGGFLAHKITSVSGSSRYFLGSIVSYSNALKTDLLGVSPQTLIQHGAVSEETVVEMARGCLAKTSADLAVSVSGIAGPSGGSPEKPVGTIWIAIAYKEQILSKKLTLSKDRQANIEYTAAIAMNLLRKFVLNL